jgi:predicted nucleic acid-binding protein
MEAEEIFLNPVVLGELYAGFVMGEREKKNRDILKDFLSSPRVQVVALDEETAERYAAIVVYLQAQGTPIPTNNLRIAATAMQYGLKLLTTDTHYQKVPQIIVECCDL